MTDADHYTNPEKATERAQARRVREKVYAHVEQHGRCSICKHRSKVERVFKHSVCVIGDIRTHPTCMKDGKGISYELDESVLEQFKAA